MPAVKKLKSKTMSQPNSNYNLRWLILAALSIGQVVTKVIRERSIVHSYSVAFLLSAVIFLFGTVITLLVFKKDRLTTLSKETT